MLNNEKEDTEIVTDRYKHANEVMLRYRINTLPLGVQRIDNWSRHELQVHSYLKSGSITKRGFPALKSIGQGSISIHPSGEHYYCQLTVTLNNMKETVT